MNDVSDIDVLRLYDFVYNNLADVKKYLFQIRSSEETAEAGRARVQVLTTMTSQLGSSARKAMANGQEHLPAQISASVNIGDYKEFMERYKGRNIEAFNSAGIFYMAGTSKVDIHISLLTLATSACIVFCCAAVRICLNGSRVVYVLPLPCTSLPSQSNSRSWSRFGTIPMKSSLMSRQRPRRMRFRSSGSPIF